MAENGRIGSLARFLSMALKERPRDFGIRVDRRGEVALMDLMGVILEEPDFSWVTVKDVEEAVSTTKPPVFEIHGTSIRVVGARTSAPGQGEKKRSGSSRRRRRRRKPRSGQGQGGKASQPSQAAARSGSSPGQEGKSSKKKGSSSRRRRRRRRPAAADNKT